MKALIASRNTWFLAERAIAQGGGLAFMAVLARRFEQETAAGLIAAYALASLFQPLFANACQPLAMRLWREEGPVAFLALWAGMQGMAGAAFLILFLSGGPAPAIFLLVLGAPLSLMSAPLIAEDRWRAVLSVLIPVGALGVTARLMALFAGNLDLAAALFMVEPLFGGVALAFRSGVFSANWRALRHAWLTVRGPALQAAAPLMLAMAATTLFWRAPILIAETALTPADVLRIAFALQIIAGFLLIPNALIQAQFGRIAAGGVERADALAVSTGVSLGVGMIAIIISLLAGEDLLRVIYGDAASGAGFYLVTLAPLVALGGIWRITEFLAAFENAGKSLLTARIVAVAGQCLTFAVVMVHPSAMAIAVGAVVSLFLSSVIAPLTLRSLRPFLFEIVSAVWRRLRPATSQAGSEPLESQG